MAASRAPLVVQRLVAVFADGDLRHLAGSVEAQLVLVSHSLLAVWALHDGTVSSSTPASSMDPSTHTHRPLAPLWRSMHPSASSSACASSQFLPAGIGLATPWVWQMFATT